MIRWKNDQSGNWSFSLREGPPCTPPGNMPERWPSPSLHRWSTMFVKYPLRGGIEESKKRNELAAPMAMYSASEAEASAAPILPDQEYNRSQAARIGNMYTTSFLRLRASHRFE